MQTDVIQKVQLVDNVFTPSEANDIVNSLINVKINFHKIRVLSMCEGDMNSDTTHDDARVSQLLTEKKEFKDICNEVRMAGKKVKISGILNVEIID